MPQADRHDEPPTSVRFPGDVFKRLAERIAETGASRSAFIIEAVREKLDREAPVS